MFRKYHSNVRIRIYDSFFSTFSSSIVLFFMPLYMAIHFGGISAGGMLVINLSVASLTSIYSGHLVDKVGRKKVLRASEFLRLLTIGCMAFFNSPFIQSPWLTFFALILFNVCTGISAPATDALILDVVGEESRKEVFNLLYWVRNFAYAIGSILGGFLFKKHLFLLFVLMFVFSFFSNLLLLFIQDQYVPAPQTEVKSSPFRELIQNYQTVLKDNTFSAFSAAIFLVMGLECELSNYIAVHLSKHFTAQNLLFIPVDGIKMVGILGLENTILVILFTPLLGKITRNWSERTSITFGVLALSLSVGWMCWDHHACLLLISMFVYTLGEIISLPVLFSLISKLAPQQFRGSYSAVVNLLMQLSVAIGAISISIGSIASEMFMPIVFCIFGFVAIALVNSAIRWEENINEIYCRD